MLKEFIFTILAALNFTHAGIAQSSSVFTDYRDGQTYKTISIKDTSTGSTVTWMAQNLNYKMQNTYAYDNNESNREEFGLLYSWEAAKEACPSGWHLATDAEWAMLVNEFGGIDTAAKALKTFEGWSEDGNGDNSSGFNGLPAGILRRNGFNDGFAVLGFLGILVVGYVCGREYSVGAEHALWRPHQ